MKRGEWGRGMGTNFCHLHHVDSLSVHLNFHINCNNTFHRLGNRFMPFTRHLAYDRLNWYYFIHFFFLTSQLSRLRSGFYIFVILMTKDTALLKVGS